MTRKCALCKGTNYKRSYSFFSAPKDPDIRKKWQAVIPIPNYTVTDETFVCSKHFKSTDIITHWVSGVPPHVITIKYKKCRLRVGAVPCLNFGENGGAPETVTVEEVDPNSELLDHEIDFLIPRENSTGYIAVTSRIRESDIDDSNERVEPPNKLGKYVFVDDNDERFSQTEFVGENNSYKTYDVNTRQQIQDSISSLDNSEFDESGNHFVHKYPQIHKVEKYVSVMNAVLEENSNFKHDGAMQDARIDCDEYTDAVLEDVKLEPNVEVFNEIVQEDDDPAALGAEHFEDNYEEDHDDSTESSEHKTIIREDIGENILEELKYEADIKCGGGNIDSELCDTMLFEDLLEIYTEVTLPRGWSFLVTSKGHATTVVYLCMNMPTNHIPVVEKQVYIKNDMIMHCRVGSKDINPFLHNLVKDGRNNRVRALSDIEELVDELDQRYICEGGPSVQNYGIVEAQLGYIDGTKWRHVGCPVLINNDSSRCSKCVCLNSIIAERRNRNIRGPSYDPLRNKQKKIDSLRRTLRNVTKRNQTLEGMKLRFKRLLLANSQRTINKQISSFEMPEIQKLMIKECLKESMLERGTKIRYSETWIFLCLQLYVESPQMYRYILTNKYMTLPSISTIKRYFHQIKTDRQFYKLFQRSVEPYQPVNEQDKKEPS